MGRALLYRCLSIWAGPWSCTCAFGPDFWFRGCDWPYRFHTACNTSQHRFLPGASSTFAGPYPGSCWHPTDLLNVHNVVRSACLSLCSKGELSCLFLIVCWWIRRGALVCHSSQRRISIGSSSFCMWGCGWWCLFHSGPCPVSTSSRMGPMSWSFSSALHVVHPRLDFLAVIAVILTLLLLMGIGIVVFDLDIARKWSCISIGTG
jgi:hypothetical protein